MYINSPSHLDARYYDGITILRNIFDEAQSNTKNWDEADNIINVIRKILDHLNYWQFTVAGKKSHISQSVPSKHRPDFQIRSAIATLAVLEAKYFETILEANKYSERYSGPLDQVMTYLDNYDNVFGFLTNGSEWYIIKKFHKNFLDPSCGLHEFIGIKFSLENFDYFDRRWKISENGFSAFLSLCFGDYLFRSEWPDGDMKYYKTIEIERRFGRSNMLVRYL